MQDVESKKHGAIERGVITHVRLPVLAWARVAVGACGVLVAWFAGELWMDPEVGLIDWLGRKDGVGCVRLIN